MSNIPEELYYTKEHEWLMLDGDTCVIGITDFAQEQLTDIVYVELPDSGSELKKDESFGVVESVKSVSDIYSPVSGEIIEVNEAVIDAPETINTDPYGDGWLVRVDLTDQSEIDTLLSAAQYQEFIETEE
jgi:glycine cleavage system H protein